MLGRLGALALMLTVDRDLWGLWRPRSRLCCDRLMRCSVVIVGGSDILGDMVAWPSHGALTARLVFRHETVPTLGSRLALVVLCHVFAVEAHVLDQPWLDPRLRSVRVASTLASGLVNCQTAAVEASHWIQGLRSLDMDGLSDRDKLFVEIKEDWIRFDVYREGQFGWILTG